jgi:DNA repair ATPase RecN
MVCEAETAKLLGELTARFGEIYMDLLLKVEPVHDLKQQIDVISDFLGRSQSEANRALSEMRQLNESGRPDPASYAALTSTFEHAQQLANDYATSREGLYERHAEALREFNALLMQEIRSIGELQVHVTAAIRRELSLETDIGDYESRLQENWQRLDVKMKNVQAHIDRG